MFRIFRFAAFALVVSMLTSGSLEALTLTSPRGRVPRDQSSVLEAIVEWIASIVLPGRSTPNDPISSQTKEGSQLDPDGGHH